MHELSIAINLVDAISEQLPRLGGVVVRRVHVRVGCASGVEADQLTSAFDVATVESPIEGAELAIERASGNELELTTLELADPVARS